MTHVFTTIKHPCLLKQRILMHRWIVNESDAERFSLPMRTLDVDSLASIQSGHNKEITYGHDQRTRWDEDKEGSRILDKRGITGQQNLQDWVVRRGNHT